MIIVFSFWYLVFIFISNSNHDYGYHNNHHYNYYHFYHDAHHGQMSQAPFLSVVKLGLIHFYHMIRYIDSSVPNWTIPRGIDWISIYVLIDSLIYLIK